ncbi:MAG TPA: hypothetical protein VFQ80_19070, partial [Thermomicrobiales bacterium]|nr:hypothetical protein [Thermomicrobiales bacterium]
MPRAWLLAMLTLPGRCPRRAASTLALAASLLIAVNVIDPEEKAATDVDAAPMARPVDRFRRDAMHRFVIAVCLTFAMILGSSLAALGAEEAMSAATAATPSASPPAVTTAPAAPAEILLSTTFPVTRLPQGSAAVEFWLTTWEPGDTYLASEYHPTVSVGGDLVLSGAYGARSDGDVIAWRDGRKVDVPRNQEVVLHPDDAIVYLDNAANEWLRDAGDTT